MCCIVLILLALVGCTICQQSNNIAIQQKELLFNEWKIFFNKTYSDNISESHAFRNWKLNLDTINKWNSNNDRLYTLKMNQFSDLSSIQIKSMFTTNQNQVLTVIPSSSVNLPSSIDWTNVAGSVMNQDTLSGGSWSICIAQSISSFYTIQKEMTNSLSAQEIIDCADSYTSIDKCFEFILTNGGLCNLSDYPFKAKKSNCMKNNCSPIQPIKSYINTNSINNSSALQSALLNGPIVVGVQADQHAWLYYGNGVLTGDCGTNIDHMVLLVGYGTYQGTKYWKIKNSWGTTWGIHGYAMICRDCNKNSGNGQCGILKQISYPILEILTPSPSVVPSKHPTKNPSNIPTTQPTVKPTNQPTKDPTEEPTIHNTSKPSNIPTMEPTIEPTSQPTKGPTHQPTMEPTVEPTPKPTHQPTHKPSISPKTVSHLWITIVVVSIVCIILCIILLYIIVKYRKCNIAMDQAEGVELLHNEEGGETEYM